MKDSALLSLAARCWKLQPSLLVTLAAVAKTRAAVYGRGCKRNVNL
jgi:hypothetical protein